MATWEERQWTKESGGQDTNGSPVAAAARERFLVVTGILCVRMLKASELLNRCVRETVVVAAREVKQCDHGYDQEFERTGHSDKRPCQLPMSV